MTTDPRDQEAAELAAYQSDRVSERIRRGQARRRAADAALAAEAAAAETHVTADRDFCRYCSRLVALRVTSGGLRLLYPHDDEPGRRCPYSGRTVFGAVEGDVQ